MKHGIQSTNFGIWLSTAISLILIVTSEAFNFFRRKSFVCLFTINSRVYVTEGGEVKHAYQLRFI